MRTSTGESNNRLALFGVAVAAIACLLLTGNGVAQVASSDTWSSLRHRTGWIILGVISEAGRWETEPSFKNLSGVEHKPPTLGDKIRVTSVHTLYIPGYGRERDESRVYEVPASKGVLMDEDQTGLELMADTELKVEAIVKGPGHASKWVVWARVVPVVP